jgi:hypothetical protein
LQAIAIRLQILFSSKKLIVLCTLPDPGFQLANGAGVQFWSAEWHISIKTNLTDDAKKSRRIIFYEITQLVVPI